MRGKSTSNVHETIAIIKDAQQLIYIDLYMNANLAHHILLSNPMNGQIQDTQLSLIAVGIIRELF